MASPRQIRANQRNGAKSRGPHTQEGKARSRMNALRHGLAAVFTGTGDDNATVDDSDVDAMYQRLRQIEVERVKVLTEVHKLSRSEDPDTLHTAVGRLAALKRYSQRAHSQLKKHMYPALRVTILSDEADAAVADWKMSGCAESATAMEVCGSIASSPSVLPA